MPYILLMRTSLLFLTALLAVTSAACTLAKVTRNGYTLVGNNEDAWSINARIRFVQGKAGEYGAVYLCHFNGSPMRSMSPQGGMNEAGLMYDGLVVEPKGVEPQPGKSFLDFTQLMPLVMRRCASVHEAEALIRTFDVSYMSGSMIVLVDGTGEYLIVQNDTMFTGNDPTYAAGNFRPAGCMDFSAVPIPRYQKGRALLAEGADTSLAFCTAVMDSMRACRIKLGNGTLYTNIFDLQRGLLHLYFYHDFSEVRTFDLKEELAKEDHEMEMASLFGTRPEYEKLVAYVTPFHQRWLFWTMTGWVVFTLLVGLYCAIRLLRDTVRYFRRREHGPLSTPLLLGLTCVALASLLTVLLLNEAPYYFGLSTVHPMLGWLPLSMLLLIAGLYLLQRKGRAPRWALTTALVVCAPVFAWLGYWQLLLP